MKIIIHRGNEEIGASCIEVRTANTRILFDVGREIEGERAKLPSNLDGVGAVVITHAHPDHFGLLNQLPASIPVYCGALTEDLIRLLTAFNSHFEQIERKFLHFSSRKEFSVGDVKIIPHPTDHSVPDSYAFLVRGDGKQILISGDFRLHGRKAVLMQKCEASAKGSDALVVDGTGIQSIGGTYLSEKDVENAICKVLQEEETPAFLCSSTINVDRLVSAFKAAKRAGRIFVTDIYTDAVLWTMNKKYKKKVPISEWSNVKVLSRDDIARRQRNVVERIQNSLELQEFRKTLYSEERAIKINEIASNPSHYLVIAKAYQVETFMKQMGTEKASFIYSLWDGYMSPEFDKNGQFKKLKESSNIHFHNIHTSGHSTREELFSFIDAVAPKKLVPFHTVAPKEFLSKYPDALIGDDAKEINL